MLDGWKAEQLFRGTAVLAPWMLTRTTPPPRRMLRAMQAASTPVMWSCVRASCSHAGALLTGELRAESAAVPGVPGTRLSLRVDDVFEGALDQHCWLAAKS
jgi:hypothetical protein